MEAKSFFTARMTQTTVGLISARFDYQVIIYLAERMMICLGGNILFVRCSYGARRCLPVPFRGHSSQGLFHAAPTEQQHLLRKTASATTLLHELGPGPWVK